VTKGYYGGAAGVLADTELSLHKDSCTNQGPFMALFLWHREGEQIVALKNEKLALGSLQQSQTTKVSQAFAQAALEQSQTALEPSLRACKPSGSQNHGRRPAGSRRRMPSRSQNGGSTMLSDREAARVRHK